MDSEKYYLKRSRFGEDFSTFEVWQGCPAIRQYSAYGQDAWISTVAIKNDLEVLQKCSTMFLKFEITDTLLFVKTLTSTGVAVGGV